MNLQKEIEQFNKIHQIKTHKITNTQIKIIESNAVPKNTIIDVNSKTGKIVAVIKNVK